MRSSGSRLTPARRLAAALIALALIVPALSAQSSQPGPLYKEALAREAALRADLEAHRPGQPSDLLPRLRIMIDAYDDLAQLFPTSGYSDNALWQGGLLAADTFFAFGEVEDLTTALRMLRAVPERFPTSSLNAEIPAQIARLERVDPAVVAARVDAAGAKTVAAARPAVPPPPPGAAETVRAAAPPPPAPAGRTVASASAVTLRRITREVRPDVLRVTLVLDREVSFYHEQVAGAPRVYIDLRYTRPSPALRDATLPFTDDTVRQVRVAEHPDHRTRVVLNLAPGEHPYTVYTLYNPDRIVIDFERDEDRRGSGFQVPGSGFVFGVPVQRSAFSVVGSGFGRRRRRSTRFCRMRSAFRFASGECR